VPQITSRQHPLVRAFKAAARGDVEVLIDGWHLLHEACDAGLAISTTAIVDAPEDPAHLNLLDRLSRAGTIVTVSRAVMDALSPVRTPSGVVALATARRSVLQDVLAASPALVVVAVDVQDPGNAGAIVRSAEAGGATGVVFTGESADPWGWKALRAAMGSTFRVPVAREPQVRHACETLQRAGLRLHAAVPHGGVPIEHVDLRGAAALLLGGEGGGLTNDLLLLADTHVTIPMAAPVESLNVAVAAALLVYEARRQRLVGG
jgi:TrmH family RNA methyltransferase